MASQFSAASGGALRTAMRFSGGKIMRLAFKHKLSLTLTLLSVGIAGLGVYLLYAQAYELVLTQIGHRLRDMGSTASFLFGPKERAQIKRLTGAVERGQLPLDRAKIKALPDGEIMKTLPPDEARKLMKNEGFQHLVQLLRQIKEASRLEIKPYPGFLPQRPADMEDNPFRLKYVYLAVRAPDFSNLGVLKFLADSDYEDMPDEEGNPIGTLYRETSADPVLTRAFETGRAEVGRRFVTDRWGTILATAVPLKDADGRVIAVLGLDLEVSGEANRLQQLRMLSLGVVATVFLLALGLSYFLAWRMSLPVNALRKGADRVRRGDLNTRVEVHSHDELEMLAETFNRMVAQIRGHTQELEDKVTQRTRELEQANREISLLNAQLRADNLRMGTELEVARQLQQMVLPRAEEFNTIPELDIAGFMLPASEVGGDYYDVLRHEDRIKIGIGDVTGHGLESGVLMLMVQTAVRTLLANGVNEPQTFMHILNQVIYDNLQRMQSDKNLTLALLDYHGGRLLLTGQHEEVLVVRAEGRVERIDTIDLGFMVGLKQDIRDLVRGLEIHLQPGDGVVLYTDGITEAMDDLGTVYGISRLCEMISQNWRASAREIQDAIINDVRRHIGKGEPFDDITLLVFKQKGRSAPESGQVSV